MIKASTHQEDTTMTNLYTPNITELQKHKKEIWSLLYTVFLLTSKWIIKMKFETEKYKTSRKKHRRKSLLPWVRQSFLRHNTKNIIHRENFTSAKLRITIWKTLWTEWKGKP